MTKSNDPSAPQGAIPLYQLDIELFEQQALDEFICEQLARYMKSTGLPETPSSGLKLFSGAHQFEFEIMLWLDPGYFLVLPLQVRFDYVKTARYGGEDFAPYRISLSTRFEFPITQHTGYAIAARVSRTEQTLMALQAIVRDIVAFGTRLFLSEARIL